MQSIIYFTVALVAFTAAKQLNPGPSAITDTSSSSKTNDKRFVTQEYTLYLTPSELKALQDVQKAAKKSEEQSKKQQQFTISSYNQQSNLNEWPKYNGLSSIEEVQAEKQDIISQSPYYLTSKPVYESQDGDFSPFSINREQKQEQVNLQRESGTQESEWIPYNPISTKAQEESLLHDQLQEHWNRILEHNRGQLKSLSSESNKKNSKESKENRESNYQWQSISNEEDNKAEIEREIEYALRHQQALDNESGRDGQANNQRSPILIHKEVRVTKHHPVHVVKKVNVPTPVLVPVPEPYEVKVPHPYPVPLEIIKHIPVPVIRHH